MSNFSNLRAFITGGTGFIGGRLTQSLIKEHGAAVTVLAHRTSAGALRAARDGAELCFAPLTDESALVKATAGVDVIFHLAFGKYGDAAEQKTITIDGTRALVNAALKNKVKNFVYVSTCAVYYNKQTEATITENSPSGPWGWNYADEKYAAEEVVRAAIRDQGLPGTIIQVVGVYGPWGDTFTVGPLKQLSEGRVVLPNDGSAYANPTFVDDVVQALYLSLQNSAIGQTFIIRGPDQATRKQYYNAYEKMLGITALEFMPLEEIKRQSRMSWRGIAQLAPAGIRALSSSRDFKEAVRETPFAPMARKLYRSLQLKKTPSVAAAAPAKTAPQKPLIFPPAIVLEFGAAKLEYSPQKAIDILGYKPRYSLAEGMALTEEWAKWARLTQHPK
ncbi:NAD(P)-dependent oxidoreductase [Roseiarcaceae bacterium H3SJ34-1]|uniref:NAD-dependent epimerase/dehydratase family protein n=1 Tax=Terripilifer ovatus TaxID=3032367 RepID=UPI003AB96592|nr:NAD(P)-dependent oxidoreductase [Roseiarcaceae bacterium H3SJ34-1]